MGTANNQTYIGRLSPVIATNALRTLGLGLCVYLLWIKGSGRDCLLVGCNDVLNSKLASVLGLPVSLWGLWLWLGTYLPGISSRICAVILAGGGIALLFLQLFVLGHFCLFCALHSITAVAFWLILLFHGKVIASAQASMVPLVIVLGGFVPALIILGTQSSGRIEEAAKAVDTTAIDSSACLNWFGQPKAHAPIVVLSVSCPHCLDVLSRWQKNNRMDESEGPKLFFYAQTNLELTQLFVACVGDGNGGLDKKAFSRMVGFFPDLEDSFMLQDASQLRGLAAKEFPGYESHLPWAEKTLRKQQGQLNGLHISAVPYFVDSNSLVRPLLNDMLIWNH